MYRLNNTNNFDKRSTYLGKETIIGGIGYDRVRKENIVIYASKQFIDNQLDESIEEHDDVILLTIEDIRNNLQYIIENNTLYCPHNTDNEVGYIADIDVVDNEANPKYCCLYYISHLYDDKVPFVLNYYFPSRIQDRRCNNSYFEVGYSSNYDEYEVAENKTLTDKEIDFVNNNVDTGFKYVNMSGDSKKIAKSILDKKIKYSNSYSFDTTQKSDNLWFVTNKKLTHLAIVRTPRYRKCKGIVLNEKKNFEKKKEKMSVNNITTTTTTPTTPPSSDQKKEEPKKEQQITQATPPNQQPQQEDPQVVLIRNIRTAEAAINKKIDPNKPDKEIQDLLCNKIAELEIEQKKKFEELFSKEKMKLDDAYNVISNKTDAKLDDETTDGLKRICISNKTKGAWSFLTKLAEHTVESRKRTYSQANPTSTSDIVSNEKDAKKQCISTEINEQSKKLLQFIDLTNDSF